MYLIDHSQEDSGRVQRQVLTRLDAWVEGVATDAAWCVDEAGVRDALRAIRAEVLSDQAASGDSQHLAEG
jgi:hypothetical protein